MAQKSRIFLAAPQDLDSHTCHKTTKLRQTDIVYLVTESTEDGELSEPVKEFLGGKQVFVHTDDLIGFLRDRCSGKETIYFIGEHMAQAYEEISSELLNYCDGVGRNQTFGVRNVRLKKLEQQTVDDFLINHITAAINESTTTEPIKPDQPNIVGISVDNSEKDRAANGQPESNPDEAPIDENSGKEKTESKASAKVDSTGKKPIPKPRKDPKRRFQNPARADDKKPKDAKSEGEIDLNALFEGGNSPDRNTSNAKASLMAALLERVHRHAEAVLVQRVSDEQYFQLMLILMKSESLEEACESWQCLQPNIPLKITTGEFSALKSEAVYYGKVSDMLYGEDLWNY